MIEEEKSKERDFDRESEETARFLGFSEEAIARRKALRDKLSHKIAIKLKKCLGGI